MKKKRYLISLNEEKAEYIKVRLKKSNMSLSTLFSFTVDEIYENLTMIEEKRENSGELKTPELLESMAAMIRKMQE